MGWSLPSATGPDSAALTWETRSNRYARTTWRKVGREVSVPTTGPAGRYATEVAPPERAPLPHKPSYPLFALKTPVPGASVPPGEFDSPPGGSEGRPGAHGSTWGRPEPIVGSGGCSPATVVASGCPAHLFVCAAGRPASPHPPPTDPSCRRRVLHRAPHRHPRRHHPHRLRHHRSRHLLHHLSRPLRRRRRCRFPPLPPSEPAAAVTSPPPRRLVLSLPPPSCQVGCDWVRLREELCICCRGSRRAEHACAREGRRRGRHMHVTCAGAVCVVCSVHEDVRACRAAAAWMQLFCAPPSHVMSKS